MDYQSENTVVNDVEVNLENILDNITFWVSADDGSENNPFKSISHAITEASKNTRNIIINIASGIYSGNLNTGLYLSSLKNQPDSDVQSRHVTC